MKLIEFNDNNVKVRIPRYITFKIPDPVVIKDKKPLFLIALLMFSMFGDVVFATDYTDDFEGGQDWTQNGFYNPFNVNSTNALDGVYGLCGFHITGGDGLAYHNVSGRTTYSWFIKEIGSDDNYQDLIGLDSVGVRKMMIRQQSGVFRMLTYNSGWVDDVITGCPSFAFDTWYKVEIGYTDSDTTAYFNVYNENEILLCSDSQAVTGVTIDRFSFQNGNDVGVTVCIDNVNLGRAGINLYGKYNATLITDNSTNHFFKFNTTQTLNFNSFNSSGSSLSGLQMLNYSIPDLSLYNVNVTSGASFNITFNNSGVSNYTVIVQDYYNSSTSLTSYFYTADVNSWSSIYSDNVLVNSTNWINSSMIISMPVGAISYNTTLWNNTYYNGLSNNFIVSGVSGYNSSVLWDNYVNISFMGTNLTFNNTLREQTFYNPFIDNCSYFSVRALNITWLDEVTKAPVSSVVNGSIFMSIDMPVGNDLYYNFSFNNVTEVGLCIYPAWASYDFSANLTYESTGYFGREYYYSDSSLNNITDILSLYLLSDAVGDRIDFEVYDQFNNELEGYYVKVKRWYSDTDAYVVVDFVRTNYLGEASSYIHYSGTQNVYYELLVEDGEHLPVYTISKQRYYDPIQTLRITITEGSTDFLSIRGNYVFSSNVDEVQAGNTTILSGTLTDTSGASILGGVNVFRVFSTNMTGVSGCNNSAVSNSLTVACDLGNVTGNTYFIEAYAIYDNVRFVVYSDYLYFESYMDYGNNGLIVGVILFGFLIFAGLYIGMSSGSMVIGGLVGYMLALIINGAFNIVYINPMVSSIMWGFGIVIAGLCIWRME